MLGSVKPAFPHTVTVIIPVYGNREDTLQCIASCKTHIDARHTILIVDDASPDPEVGDSIRRAIEGVGNMRYVRNSENLGFVKTCNRAVFQFDQTENDILLLNSDAVVTSNALEEMLACLYAAERHAVCCPRTDDATILTFPQVKGPVNAVEKQDRYACWHDVHHLLPRFSVLPTGVGFCMLIRRSIIQRFGLFDEAFGRGYNEENDFCARINRHGYSAVAAHHAFVFHKRLRSFDKEERSALESKNYDILTTRYPEYEDHIKTHEQFHIPAVEHFAHVLHAPSARPTVLIDLSHLSIAHNGTSIYALSLIRALQNLPNHSYDLQILALPSHNAFFHFSERGIDICDTIRGPVDLVFVPHQIFDLHQLTALNRLAARIAVNVHDVIALRSNYLSLPAMEMCFEHTLRFADGIVTISDASQQDMLALGSYVPHPKEQLITTIHHGVDLPNPLPDLSLDDQHIIPQEPFLLLMGNIFVHKNIDAALQQIPPDITTVVIGGKGDYKKMRPRTVCLPSGFLAPALIEELINRCHMVLFPSEYEGWGLPVVQAALRGKHVITRAQSVYNEMSALFPVSDLLHTFDSFEGLGALVQKVWSLPQKEAIAHCRSWHDAAVETDAFFQTLLKKKIDPTALQQRFSTLTLLEHEHGIGIHTPETKTEERITMTSIPLHALERGPDTRMMQTAQQALNEEKALTHALSTELSGLLRRVTALQHEKKEHRKIVEYVLSLRDHYYTLKESYSHLLKSYSSMLQSHESLQASERSLHQELDWVHRSRSWRITAPLRTIAARGKRAAVQPPSPVTMVTTPKKLPVVPDLPAYDRPISVETHENDEVIFLRSLLPKDSRTFLVDVGAHDGSSMSNSLAFIQDGWRAVLIEPTPVCFAELTKLHKKNENVHCVRMACGKTKESRPLYFGTHGNHMMNTLCTDDTDWFRLSRGNQSIMVDVDTLTSILDDHDAPSDFSLLLIDAEGMDYEVLLGLDPLYYCPRIIVTEEYSSDLEKQSKKSLLLIERGYRFVANIGPNTIWAHASVPTP